MPDTPAPPRRRLSLSLRASMALVLLIGGLAGWMAHEIRSQREAIAAIEAGGGRVTFDFQAEAVGTGANGRPTYRAEPAAPRWLRLALGDELFRAVRTVSFDEVKSPEALAAVASLGRVEILGFRGPIGDAAWLRPLRGMGRVGSVGVPASALTDALLAEFARIPTIREFSASRGGRGDAKSTATDAGFAELARLGGLEVLGIADCPMLTDAATARLVAALPRLKKIYLDSSLDSPALTLQAMARHQPDLERLSLDRSGVTDADLAAVEGLTNLESLNLQGNPGITDAGLAHLRPLRKLNQLFVNLRPVTDEGVRHLSGLTHLQYLYLDASQVTDAGLDHLASLANLKYLGLTATRLTDAGMPAVARLASLEEIHLARLPGLTDAGLVPLRALGKLQRLDVSGTGVTPSGVAALRAALPTLRQVANRPLPPPLAR